LGYDRTNSVPRYPNKKEQQDKMSILSKNDKFGKWVLIAMVAAVGLFFLVSLGSLAFDVDNRGDALSDVVISGLVLGLGAFALTLHLKESNS
jgi:hypothetical protein